MLLGCQGHRGMLLGPLHHLISRDGLYRFWEHGSSGVTADSVVDDVAIGLRMIVGIVSLMDNVHHRYHRAELSHLIDPIVQDFESQVSVYLVELCGTRLATPFPPKDYDLVVALQRTLLYKEEIDVQPALEFQLDWQEILNWVEIVG